MKNVKNIKIWVRALALSVSILPAVFLLVPIASADGIQLIDPIIGVANAPSTPNCSSNGLTNGGGLICSGNTTAFSLTALKNGTESLQAVVSTQTSPVYLVNNDTGSSSFTLVFNGGLAFNQFLDCQENGGFAGKSCTTSGALGTVGNSAQYGPPSGLVNGQFWNPDASLMFTGIGAGNFEITFASFGNGASGTLTGEPIATPEPSSLALLMAGLLGLAGFAHRRLTS
jgi:PEP-CTERM motif